MIPIFDIKISKKSKDFVNQCLKKNFISSQGNFIKEFEREIAKFHKMKYCLVTSSCTTALHLSLRSLLLKKGDEIICPALSFISPANMILLESLKLRLVDIDEETLNINPDLIIKNINKKTKAILVVHQFGHSAQMDKIMRIARKNGLKVIEDNAESIGGKFKNKLNGTLGDVSTLSFYANKIITTGEGGAILTNNKSIYKRCLLMRDHGMSVKKRYYHKILGFNYRMTNLQAAIGLAQFKEIKKILKYRLKQMNLYNSELKNVKDIKIRKFKNWCTPVHWLMTIRCRNQSTRNKLMRFLRKRKIETRQMIFPINFAKYINISKKFKTAEKVSLSSMHLPSGYNIKNSQVKYISSQIKDFFQR
tara:strand:- start:197 stop:1285 length:1089 start_codon:yes stop_codon:yes gene_type:complete